MHLVGGLLAVLALSATFGGMVFFAVIVTPLVFGTLSPEDARVFTRAAFPRYYRYIAIASGLAALGLLLHAEVFLVSLPILVLVSTLWLWMLWLPHLNDLREGGDRTGFTRGHRLSVMVNIGAMMLTLITLVVLFLR